jgi:hypothetical protein
MGIEPTMGSATAMRVSSPCRSPRVRAERAAANAFVLLGPWLAVKAARASGSVVVVAKAAGDRATYEWQYSKVGEPGST